MGHPEKIRLGDLLIQQQIISAEQCQQALELQKINSHRLGRVLVQLGFATEQQISEAVARQFHIPFIDIRDQAFDLLISRRLPENQARRLRAVVLEDCKQTFLVAMVDPTDLVGHTELTKILQRDIEVAVVMEGQLLEAIDRIYLPGAL